MNLYDQINDETKKYLNKVMDVYSTIKDNEIVHKIKKFGMEEDYRLSKHDKKVLSLFIAGFLVEGNLKRILDEYDDVRIQDLLSFAGIKKEEIHKLDDSEYSDFFDNSIKLDIDVVLKKGYFSYGREIKFITPEIITLSLNYLSNFGSRVIQNFGDKFNIDINGHELFEALESYALKNGYMSEIPKETPKLRGTSILLDHAFDKNMSSIPKEKSDKEKTNSEVSLEKVWGLIDDIQKKFIGQEIAAEYLFYNIVNNQKLALKGNIVDGERSIIFVDGPTGTGKTAITREITQKLGIPFVSTPIINYSSTGYVGSDITDVLKSLYEKADEDLDKAQRGIVVFDEFDKLTSSSRNGLEMKKAVQQQLLDFLGGGKYKIQLGNSFFDRSEIEFDTSKLTFICLGALTNLRDSKIGKTSLGFGVSNEPEAVQEYSITPQDLIDIGFERELVGRFNTYLHTEEYSKETLLKILKESEISPLIGFEKWINSNGKKLEMEEGVYEAIADAAYELNTGARSLQTVMNNIRTYFLKEVLRGKDEVIHLDLDTVININNSVINRKARI